MWNIVIIGLSITSSWGNGHATTYRALTRALANRGHSVTFLEHDMPWYRNTRDMPCPPAITTRLYHSLDDLRDSHGRLVRDADLVIIGSYVPEGIAVCHWVLDRARGLVAFYDIDTPVTLAALANGQPRTEPPIDYISRALIPRFDLYLSFTGGPTLQTLEKRFGAHAARALYCSVDPDQHHPSTSSQPAQWDLGYLGTYASDRQSALEQLLLTPAGRWEQGRFVVAGPNFPNRAAWPGNVRPIEHLPPADHRRFYTSQRFTLNITRAAMISSGYAPSVRLFEAAACGTPIISDWWPGLDTLFKPGHEILIARSSHGVLDYLQNMAEEQRLAIGDSARQRILRSHTAARRVIELEGYVQACLGNTQADLEA